MSRAADLIAQLSLEPHPEGGWYRQVFKSPHHVKPDDDRDSRSALTAIYFLLEIWIHLEGGTVMLHVGHETRRLSAHDERLVVVPANVWQSAEIEGDYALVTCVVGPGFEFEDFTLQ